MVAYFKKSIEPITVKEFIKQYKWVSLFLIVFQLWAIYRKAESWLFFGLACVLFVISLLLRVYRKSGFAFKICMGISILLMLFQWYAVPGNFRTDSISVIYGDKDVICGAEITDEKLIEEITDCMKEIRIPIPLNNYIYDMNKSLLIEINGETYTLYGLYGMPETFNNHCGIYLFNKLHILYHYLPSEFNDKLNELIREAKPDIVISKGATDDEVEEKINEMINVLDLDCDKELLNWVNIIKYL